MKIYTKDGAMYEFDPFNELNTVKSNFYRFYANVNGEEKLIAITDHDVDHIEDDVRFGDYYCVEGDDDGGRYEDIERIISENLAKAHKCKDCTHHWKRIIDSARSFKNSTISEDGNEEIFESVSVYKISCAYDQCVFDVSPKPVLYRDEHYCFFCDYPDGLPDNSGLIQFIIDNAEKYGMTPKDDDDRGAWRVDIAIQFLDYSRKEKFGSYRIGIAEELKLNGDGTARSIRYFCFYNKRDAYKFNVDLDRNKFILHTRYSYEADSKLYKIEYVNGKEEKVPVKAFSDFAFWFWLVVNDYKNSLKEGK